MFHSYFNEYAFAVITNTLLTNSEEVLRLLCTLHRRKFRTNVSVHICNNLNVLYNRLF